MADKVPSVGRVVHFVAVNSVHVPADVCGVFEDNNTVTLFIKDHTRDKTYFEFGVPFEATGTAIGTYHWPEYVPAKGE